MNKLIDAQLKSAVLLSLLSLYLVSCATPPYYWPEKKGVVLEKGTDKPLKDVFVVARWTGQFGLAGVRTKCYHMEVTKTNTKGEFTMPGYLEGVGFLNRRFAVLTFKSRTHKEFKKTRTGRYYDQNKFYLEPFTGTREERFDYLTKSGRGPSCHDGGKSNRSAFPVHKMVYEEAKLLATTKKEKRKVQRLRQRMAATLDDSIFGLIGKDLEKRILEVLREQEIREQGK